MTSEDHEPNKRWTIQIKHCGMNFHITNIPFKNIAEYAAKGIEEGLTKSNLGPVEVKVFLVEYRQVE